MLLFHEGLPRSGKSFEAMVRHIATALRNGRTVHAYIEGINHAKVAEALGDVPEERVRELLHQLTREQVPKFYEYVTPNSLIVLDEAQNFWPNGRQKLDEQTTQAITEHGHLGQDILLMGQDLRDVHALWRRRVSQRVVFNKLDAVGQEGRYSVTVYKATAPEKFAKVTSAIEKYDPAWFGTYASHVSDAIQTGNYKDARANAFNSFIFKWGLPLGFGALVWGGFTLWGIFHSAEEPKAKPAAKPVTAPAPGPSTALAARAVPAGPKVFKSFVAELNERYRPRMAGHWTQGGHSDGWIEWWDGKELRERLTFAQIVQLGGTVYVAQGMVRVLDKWATPWPRPDEAGPYGRVLTVGAPGVGP